MQRSRCPALAHQTAHDALATARLQSDLWTTGVCLLHIAEAHLDFDQADAAQTTLAEAQTIFARYGDRYHLLRWRMLAARLAHAQQDWATLGEHVPALLSDLNQYPALAAAATNVLAPLLAGVVEQCKDQGATLCTLAVVWGDAFAPLAAALLAHQRSAVRAWTINVLAQHRKPWSWALLADHQEAQPAIRTQIKVVLKKAEAYPLPHLDLTCLGAFAVRQDTLVLAAERWTSIHAQLVLVYLALRGPATRDELIDLLWPNENVGKAGARLRTTIRLLRKTLNPPWHPHADYVVYQHEQYGIDGQVQVTSDVLRFGHWVRIARQGEGAARHHACRQALACYSGAFFPGSYNDWVVARREHLQADWLWVGEEWALGLLLGGKFDEAEAHARHVIRSDLFRERAWHVLLRSLHGQGRRADVVKTYHTMVERFDHELGIAPDAETQQLIASLQQHAVDRIAYM